MRVAMFMRDCTKERKLVRRRTKDGRETRAYAGDSFIDLLDLVLVRNVDIGEKVSDVALQKDQRIRLA
jgi:hypothetical protein